MEALSAVNFKIPTHFYPEQTQPVPVSVYDDKIHGTGSQ
jgi:hypothetical protein